MQLECLVIAACVTPTDPVLANVSEETSLKSVPLGFKFLTADFIQHQSICKGRYAEKYEHCLHRDEFASE
jgi:hypothetical protein